MLQRLSDKGFIDYEKYKGVTLTSEGERLASRVQRKHRLAERFLTQFLGMPEGEMVHDQACKLEHAISDEVEMLLCRLLDHEKDCPIEDQSAEPCPWENPISAHIINPPTTLKKLNPGDEAIIKLVIEEPHEKGLLLGQGIKPGTEVCIIEQDLEFVVFEVNGSRFALDAAAASRVLVATTSNPFSFVSK